MCKHHCCSRNTVLLCTPALGMSHQAGSKHTQLYARFQSTHTHIHTIVAQSHNIVKPTNSLSHQHTHTHTHTHTLPRACVHSDMPSYHSPLRSSPLLSSPLLLHGLSSPVILSFSTPLLSSSDLSTLPHF